MDNLFLSYSSSEALNFLECFFKIISHSQISTKLNNDLKVYPISRCKNKVSLDQAQGYKTASMLNSTEHDSSSAHKNFRNTFFAFKLSDILVIMLINIKIGTIIVLFTSLYEHDKLQV